MPDKIDLGDDSDGFAAIVDDGHTAEPNLDQQGRDGLDADVLAYAGHITAHQRRDRSGVGQCG
jgi:hypothetical protein